ncbi:uncharacterized protein LOC131250564 [Magnolia sinica]|uniref:uncharacterized protein LOC131250564 n=1 Tax=Magnolia sinica TaxID=86752 RepID=UPI002658EA77|nr:uncharacterized protein LOC131250564 [Magnolia sinica]
MTFTEDNVHGIQHLHDDALVVTMTIANHKVYRILVDTGSSADVIYSEAFERMRIPRSRLRPVKTLLHGFTGERIISEGAISLPVILFGLKNARATYQRLVNQMFAKQIVYTMEVYIDDMLVKSIKASDHLVDLGETFVILREYQMKLNPVRELVRVLSCGELGLNNLKT